MPIHRTPNPHAWANETGPRGPTPNPHPLAYAPGMFDQTADMGFPMVNNYPNTPPPGTPMVAPVGAVPVPTAAPAAAEETLGDSFFRMLLRGQPLEHGNRAVMPSTGPAHWGR